jgi:membrane associated rhomboid family serine protease
VPTAGRRFSSDTFRITRGAMILLVLQVGLSLVWLFSDDAAKATLGTWFAPSPSTVFHEGKVWTLATGPLLEPRFISLVFQVALLVTLVPNLERFWGTARLLRFAAMTLLVGGLVGCLTGLLTGRDVPMLGYAPFTYASIVAFGLIYARQPVQFFGVLPMTGRQLMYGILGFLALLIVLNQEWESGAAFAAAIGLTFLIMSARYSPELAWQRWRRKRARHGMQAIAGGKPGRDDAARHKRPKSDLLN